MWIGEAQLRLSRVQSSLALCFAANSFFRKRWDLHIPLASFPHPVPPAPSCVSVCVRDSVLGWGHTETHTHTLKNK